MSPTSSSSRRGLVAICALLLLLAAWIVWGDREDRGGVAAQDRGDELSSDAIPPRRASIAPAGSHPGSAAAAAQTNIVAIVLLRAPAEDADMRRRHRMALEALGLPMPKDAKPRRPLAKEALFQPPGEQHQILVKFQDGLLARASPDGSVVVSAEEADPSLVKAIQRHGLRFTVNHTASENDLVKMESEAMAATGEYPADLGGMLLVATERTDKGAVWAAASALQELGVTEFVTLSSLDMPPPPPMPVDIAPPTPLLVANQTYRGIGGINIDAVWGLYGQQGKGGGVRVTDCEYNYNPLHEDMAGLVAPQSGVSSYYTNFGDNHGTAVLGMLVAAENAYGMTGMVPQASAHFYGDKTIINGREQSRSACITAALAASSRGDVVLLEMQTRGAGATPGSDNRYVPAEYDQAVWTAVKTGTDAGKHVVAAAGNGGNNVGENLDSSVYNAYRNRGDSGSIIVGAGDTSRARRSFSTYGSRVNLQGWGGSVASLGYGGLTYGDDHHQKYTLTFSGTSSASPIVTAAVVAVESMARSRLGRSLSPSEMRQLLVSTGKAQTGNLTTPIGPLPDVPVALAQLLPVQMDAVFSEDMGSASTTTAIAIHNFQNTNLTFSGTADVRNVTASTVYSGASGLGNVFFTNNGSVSFQISGINTLGFTGLALSLGHYKNSNTANNELVVEVSSDGVTYTALSYSRATGTGTSTWVLVQPSGIIPATANLRIRFRQTSTTAQFRIDDINLTGVRPPPPSITTPATTSSGESEVDGATNYQVIRGTSTSVSVSATDEGGEDGLIYTWSVPGGGVTFSPNGTNPAQSSTATFLSAGDYTLTVTVQHSAGSTVTSSVPVRVKQTATSVAVSPQTINVPFGTAQQFTAQARDQFANAMSAQPSFTWSVSDGGTISSGGLFTARLTGGPYAVTAAAYSLFGTAQVIVSKAVGSVALGGLSAVYDGSAKAISVTTSPLGLPVTVTYNGSPTVPTNAGSYAVVATIADANYEGSAAGTLAIAKAPATVTLGNLLQEYDGTPRPVSVTTTPLGLVMEVTYGGSATPPSESGSYSVEAAVVDANYTGYAFGTFVITGENLSFEEWIAGFEGLSDASPAGDPDDDGLSNLIEYFAGLNPALSDQGVAFAHFSTQEEANLDYRRSKLTSGITAQVTWKTDLGATSAWSLNDITDRLLEDHATYELRRATVPRAVGEERIFLRLEVTLE